MSNMSNSQACAACKHQRRKCSDDCVTAPFFPADRPHKFLDVHRLFGISNFIKLSKAVAPELRERAVETMAYEAMMRRVDPVNGCYGVIHVLTTQIYAIRRELDAIRTQIALGRQREQEMWRQGQRMQPVPSQLPPLPPLMADLGASASDLGVIKKGEGESSQQLTHSDVGDMKPFHRERSDHWRINNSNKIKEES